MSTEVLAPPHPLSPLTPEEITEGVARLRSAGMFAATSRVHGVELVEPTGQLPPTASRSGARTPSRSTA
jgi:hypothetical protein